MGKLSTLEGFTFEDLLRKLSVPDGFVIDMRCWGNTILMTIEDHRGHPNFQGDRAGDILSEFIERLADVGLDAGKAVILLSCREESIKGNNPKSFNVGVVQLGWAVSAGPSTSRWKPGQKSGIGPQQGPCLVKSQSGTRAS